MPESQPSSWRSGWPWTLLKCALAMAVSIGGFAGLLWWLVQSWDAPWWLPKEVYDWILSRGGLAAAVLGGLLGGVLGFFTSVFMVLWDARKGRLTRVR